jgi:hypothetical protein
MICNKVTKTGPQNIHQTRLIKQEQESKGRGVCEKERTFGILRNSGSLCASTISRLGI